MWIVFLEHHGKWDKTNHCDAEYKKRGSNTLAMLVSSTSMNVAIVTVSAMSQGLCFGFHSCSGKHGAACVVIWSSAYFHFWNY